MKYNLYPEKYLSQYSLTIKAILDNLGFEPIEILDNIKTGKKCFVYLRDDNINWLLCMLKVNKDLGIFSDNDTVVEYFKMKKILPRTCAEDYISRMKYSSDSFDINNHIKK